MVGVFSPAGPRRLLWVVVHSCALFVDRDVRIENSCSVLRRVEAREGPLVDLI